MHKLYFSLFTLLFFFSFTYKVFGQAKTDSTAIDSLKIDTLKEVKTSSFKFGADYISNNVFMGRTGVKNTPIISPDIKYVLKSGLYFSGDLDILPDNTTKKLNAGDLSVGYQFDINDNIDGDISYTKMFYNASSTLIGSSITNMFNATFDYQIGDILTPSISANYALNSNAPGDLFANVGIAHDFIAEKIFGDKDAIIVSPTITANFGTENFYEAYITHKTYRNKTFNQLVTTFENGLQQFKILDYEFSAPMEYKIGHFAIEFTPTYAIVENGFKSAAVAKALGLSNSTSVFYVEAGLSLKFK